jgi:hypothetical protein
MRSISITVLPEAVRAQLDAHPFENGEKWMSLMEFGQIGVVGIIEANPDVAMVHILGEELMKCPTKS